MNLFIKVNCKVLLMGLLLFFSLSNSTLAQKQKDDIAQKLKVGDMLPEYFWSIPFSVTNHPTGTKQIRLENDKNKLIILDFWATWCAPCIRAMPKLDSLQSVFGLDILILPVTNENSAKVQTMFKKQGWTLPSIVSDTLLRTIFPHDGVPHQIWIKNGKVFGESSYSEYVNADNIKRALSGDNFILSYMRPSVVLNFEQPLFFNGNGGSIQQARMRSVFSKRIADVGGVSLRKNYVQILNMPFSSLIYQMYAETIPYPGRTNRIVWDISDSLKDEFLGTNRKLTGIYEVDIAYNRWLNEYSYCYELSLDTSLDISKKDFLLFMQDDINRYFRLEKGIEAVLEKRKVLCYGIVQTGNMESRKRDIGMDSGSGDYMILNNRPVKELTQYLIAVLAKQQYPIVDMISGDFNVSLRLDKSDLTVSSIQKELNKVGIDLVLRESELDVIVVKNAMTF